MSSDIIWAVVVIYSVAVAVWLAHHIVNQRALDALAKKQEVRQLQHHQRLEGLEKEAANMQRELVVAKDAVVRIENRLASPAVKAIKGWPGER